MGREVADREISPAAGSECSFSSLDRERAGVAKKSRKDEIFDAEFPTAATNLSAVGMYLNC